MLSDFINVLNPHPDALLRAISPHITDGMLEEIAHVDYHEEVEGHLAGLLPIRNEARFPTSMQWCPGEVLALTRSSRPVEERGRWMCAFASAALIGSQLSGALTLL